MIDVGSEVSSLLRNGGTIPIMNVELGDPAPNANKALKIDFAIGTQTVSVSGVEGTSISVWKTDDKVAGDSAQISDKMSLESAT